MTAQGNPYNPVNFTEPLSLSRGSLSPASPDSVYLTHDDSCKFVQKEFAWEPSSCDEFENIIAYHVPGSDTVIVEKPNTTGFVKFDDWDKETSKEEIQAIWDEMVQGTKDQGEKLGVSITPLKWVVYPHLDRKNNYMYYAILTRWDKQDQINIKATLFDRLGYVTFRIVPEGVDFNEAQLTQMVENTLNSYSTAPQQSYFDFQDGDKVAAVGAVGVLATLVGVKYGKAVASGLFALILVFAKKLWFLIFLPLMWLYKKFSKKKS